MAATPSPQEGQMSGWNVPRNYKSIEALVKEKYKEEKDKLCYSGGSQDVSGKMHDFCHSLANALNDSFSGFKFVCSCFAVRSGTESFFFNTHCYWNKNSDGFIYELIEQPDYPYKFLVCIYVISP